MKLYSKLRNTGMTLLSGLALLSLPAVLTGCSDNEEQGLYAADAANIEISLEAFGFHNGQIDLGSAQSETVFTVTSTTRWTVEVSDCEGAWCQIVYGSGNSDDAGQIGDGTFTVDAAPNRSSNMRECNVTVYAIESDGTHIPGKSVLVHVVQDRQSIQVDYAGGEIPYYGTGTGALPVITVKANQSWQASSSHSWVKIVPGSDMDDDRYNQPEGSAEEHTVTFQISVEANPGTSVRYAEVSISSPTSAFTPIRLNITQAASNETFFVTPTEVPQVGSAGEVIEFSVYSPREGWSVQAISAGDWVTLDRTTGEASSQPVSIRATVAPNSTSTSRQASLVFTRDGGVGTTVVYITQNGNAEAQDPDETPSVSAAWIVSGWTQTWAQLRAYYVSPSLPVVGCGAYIRKVSDSGDVRRVDGKSDAGGMIIVDIESLEPDTEYEAWAYVSYEQSGMTLGVSGGSTIFRTPASNGEPGSGQPGEDDNNPPSPNN